MAEVKSNLIHSVAFCNKCNKSEVTSTLLQWLSTIIQFNFVEGLVLKINRDCRGSFLLLITFEVQNVAVN